MKQYPGLTQETQVQVKERNPLLLPSVKKSQLQVEFGMSTNRPISGALLEPLEVQGGRG